MASVFIVIKLKPKEHAKTKTYANRVYNGMVAMAATYPDPDPTMLVFKSHIDNQEAKMTAWGDEDNHGTTQDRLDLEEATRVLQEDLGMLKDYVEPITLNDGSSYLAAGFLINKIPANAPVPGGITNFRITDNNSIGTGDIGGRWDRPDGAKSFNIYMYPGNVVNLPPDRSQFLKNVRRASFKVTGLNPGQEYVFIIQSCGLTETDNYFGTVLRAKF